METIYWVAGETCSNFPSPYTDAYLEKPGNLYGLPGKQPAIQI